MSNGNLKDVYITSIGKFLLGNPISNDEMEDYLGMVGGEPSKYKNESCKPTVLRLAITPSTRMAIGRTSLRRWPHYPFKMR